MSSTPVCRRAEILGLLLDGVNPVARTNVAPEVNPPGSRASTRLLTRRPSTGPEEAISS